MLRARKRPQRAQAARAALHAQRQAAKRLEAEQQATFQLLEVAHKAERQRLLLEEEEQKKRMRSPADVLLVDREPGETQVRPLRAAASASSSSSSDYDSLSSSSSSSEEEEVKPGARDKGLLKTAMTFEPGAGKGLLKTAMLQPSPPFKAGAGKGIFASSPSSPAAGAGKGLLTMAMGRRSQTPDEEESEEDGETSDASSSSSGSRSPLWLSAAVKKTQTDDAGRGGVRLPMESEEGETSSGEEDDTPRSFFSPSAVAAPSSQQQKQREWRSVANSRYVCQV
jgi:hypothetical protein